MLTSRATRPSRRSRANRCERRRIKAEKSPICIVDLKWAVQTRSARSSGYNGPQRNMAGPRALGAATSVFPPEQARAAVDAPKFELILGKPIVNPLVDAVVQIRFVSISRIVVIVEQHEGARFEDSMEIYARPIDMLISMRMINESKFELPLRRCQVCDKSDGVEYEEVNIFAARRFARFDAFLGFLAQFGVKVDGYDDEIPAAIPRRLRHD